MDQVFVFRAVGEELLEIIYTLIPVLLLPLLKFRGQKENIQLEHIFQLCVHFVGWFGYFLPSLFNSLL